MDAWRRGAVVSGVRRMDEVNARRARLVLGWVIVFGWVELNITIYTDSWLIRADVCTFVELAVSAVPFCRC